MEHINNTNTPQIISNSSTSANDKYWCFMCEKEFSVEKTDSTEVFCPICSCISELIDPENDPRGFKLYDAQREATTASNQNTNSNTATSAQNIQANQNQPSPNVNMNQAPIFPGVSIVSQVIQGPLGRVVIQSTSMPVAVNPNMRPNQPNGQMHAQPQSQQQSQPQPQGFGALGNIIGGFIGNNPFANVFNPIFNALGEQGSNNFAAQYSRLVEEFLRNDPNTHGPPPAPQESISRLKKVKYNENTCKSKDCTVCQEDFKNEEVLVKLPCEHCFHKDCVTKWLTMHNSCPVCRKALPDPEPVVPDYIA